MIFDAVRHFKLSPWFQENNNKVLLKCTDFPINVTVDRFSRDLTPLFTVVGDAEILDPWHLNSKQDGTLCQLAGSSGLVPRPVRWEGPGLSGRRRAIFAFVQWIILENYL